MVHEIAAARRGSGADTAEADASMIVQTLIVIAFFLTTGVTAVIHSLATRFAPPP